MQQLEIHTYVSVNHGEGAKLVILSMIKVDAALSVSIALVGHEMHKITMFWINRKVNGLIYFEINEFGLRFNCLNL